MAFWILLLAKTVFTLHRGVIDTNTSVGNCTEERPVYGKPIDGGQIACYGKYDLVIDMESYQIIEFTDIFYLAWVPITHVTKSMEFVAGKWRNIDFTLFHHNIIISPTPGRLWYFLDRHDRHMFFRTFGERSSVSTTPASSTRSSRVTRTTRASSSTRISSTRASSSTRISSTQKVSTRQSS